MTPDEALFSLCSGENINSEGQTIKDFYKVDSFLLKIRYTPRQMFAPDKEQICSTLTHQQWPPLHQL